MLLKLYIADNVKLTHRCTLSFWLCTRTQAVTGNMSVIHNKHIECVLKAEKNFFFPAVVVFF